MKSKLYVGQVRHRRFTPHEHSFNYRMSMMYLDLDELPGLFDGFLLWSARRFNMVYFKKADHFSKSSLPLKQAVIELVYNETGIQLDGPIRLLTHLRYFGYGFNPVSFYYCFDETGIHLKVIVAEVNNTPWGEQYFYVLPVDTKHQDTKSFKFNLKKDFHVSPFNPMDQDYSWYFSLHDKHLGVHMENWRNGEKIFDATLTLHAREISSKSLRQALIRFPFMTFKITFSIYYQALKLLLKRTPLYTHPDKTITNDSKANGSKL